MKASKYNISVNYDDKEILYNTFTRKYVLYDSLNKKYIENLLNDLNKNRYEVTEGEILKKFINNGIVVDDKLDEFQRVSLCMNKKKYQDGTFMLVIVPTLDCNFRCVYCYEEHKKIVMNDQVMEDIIQFVDGVAKKVRRIAVSWFGGEPLLEFERIKKLTEKFKEICEREKCSYSATMTTNAYLFDDYKINMLENLNIKRVQITVDGDRDCHNRKRPHEDGSLTFDVIINNIKKIVTKELDVVLRVNFDGENKDSIKSLFDSIPIEVSKKLIVNICNVFQNNDKINQFELYKHAIDRGFKYQIDKNNYALCEVSYVNSLFIHPDGKITSCQMAAENGMFFGKINKNFDKSIRNNSEFFKIKNISALNNEKCRECDVLPMCLGGCPNKRYLNDNRNCMNRKFDGMNTEDVIRLHVYNDATNNRVKKVSII